MNPHVPEWAREVLERELTEPDVESFQVLKDGPLQKLGVAWSRRGAFFVQRTVAGGELFRIEREDDELPPTEVATCGACGTTFRFARADVAGPVHCFACGEAVGGATAAPREARRERRLEPQELVTEHYMPGREVATPIVPGVGDAEVLEHEGFAGVEGIGPAHANALRAAGIRDRASLAGARPADVARATGAPLRTAERWQAMARLLEVESLAGPDARRLTEAGVTGVEDLATRDPQALASATGVPEDVAQTWVERARERRSAAVS